MKKNIVFIHGMFQNPKSWEKWIAYFNDKVTTHKEHQYHTESSEQ